MKGGRGGERPVKFRATIFDFDGVLADTEPLHFRTFARVLAEEGIDISPEQTGNRYVGVSDREGFRLVFRDHGRGELADEDADELARRKSELYRAGVRDVPLVPGARDLIASAMDRGPATIASGSLREDLEAVLRAHDLLDRFPRVVSGDDIRESKPHPEGFLKALAILREERADLDAADCLVFEDSLRGVEAARRAGMWCVAITTSFPAPDLEAAGARRVIDRLSAWDWRA